MARPLDLTVVATDLGFTEGPVWLPDGGLLVTSMSTGRLVWLDPSVGVIADATVGSGPNGATVAVDGSVMVAQCGHASSVGLRGALGADGGVQRLAPGGEVEWVTTEPVAPNDLCFGPDGFVYLTDPSRETKHHSGRIWRVDPASGHSVVLAEVDWYPNGIGFDTDDDSVVVADTTGSRLVRFPFDGDRLGAPETIVAMPEGHPDGFAFDVDGNVVVATVFFEPDRRGQLQMWSPAGVLVGSWEVADGPLATNVAIDGDGTLAVTAASDGTVMVGRWERPGLPLHPLR